MVKHLHIVKILNKNLAIALETEGGLNEEEADLLYLRLDTANDPLTGNLDLGSNDITNVGQFEHIGSTFGIFGVTPTTQPPAYTPTNVTTDRSYDANSTTVNELADVLGTLIADLQSLGVVG